jgi:hypothetical protein
MRGSRQAGGSGESWRGPRQADPAHAGPGRLRGTQPLAGIGCGRGQPGQPAPARRCTSTGGLAGITEVERALERISRARARVLLVLFW